MAVALLAARLPPRAPVGSATLLDGADPAEVIDMLATITSGLLDHQPGRGERLLQAIGLLAATHDLT